MKSFYGNKKLQKLMKSLPCDKKQEVLEVIGSAIQYGIDCMYQRIIRERKRW